MSRDRIVTGPKGLSSDFPQVTGTDVGVDKHALDVYMQGGTVTVNVGGSPLADINWDACDAQQTSATVETYVFKTGGISGTTVATCTVTYTSAAKTDLDTVVWS